MSTPHPDPAHSAAATGAVGSSTKVVPPNASSAAEPTSTKSGTGASAGVSKTQGRTASDSVIEGSTAGSSRIKSGAAAASSAHSGVSGNIETFSINNPSNSDDLNPLVRISLSPVGKNGNPQEAARKGGYAVTLLSGTELCLNRKSLLLANLEALQKLLDSKQCHVENLDSYLDESRKSVQVAEAKLLVARDELEERKVELEHCEAEMASAVQEKDDLAKKIEVAKVAADELCPAAQSMKTEAIAKNARGDHVKRTAGNQSAGENKEDGTGRNRIGGEKLAGKRSRDENKITSGDKNISHGEPPKKMQKCHDPQGPTDGNSKISSVESHDAVAKPKSNAKEVLRSDLDEEEPLVISSHVLRSKVRECINENRKTEGLVPVPLDEMVFCIMRETGTSLFDENYIREATLAASDITIGVRYFPSLTFEKLILPFRVLARSIEREASEQIDSGDGESSASGQDGGNKGNCDNDSDSGDMPASDQQWWAASRDFKHSEESATTMLASKLLKCDRIRYYEDPTADDSQRLFVSFFRHYFSQSGCSSERHDSESLYRIRSNFGSLFPSANAWAIAAFQLGESDAATAPVSPFPKWTAHMLAGLLLHARPRWMGFVTASHGHACSPASPFHKSVISALRILVKYTSVIPELTRTVWCWHPPSNLNSGLSSPLTLVGDLDFNELDMSVGQSGSFFTAWSEILLDVFKIANGLASDPSASRAEKETLWNLKESICGRYLADNEEWRARISGYVEEHADADVEKLSINYALPEFYERPKRKAKLALFRGIHEIEVRATRLRRLDEIAEKQKELEEEREKLEAEVATAAALV